MHFRVFAFPLSWNGKSTASGCQESAVTVRRSRRFASGSSVAFQSHPVGLRPARRVGRGRTEYMPARTDNTMPPPFAARSASGSGFGRKENGLGTFSFLSNATFKFICSVPRGNITMHRDNDHVGMARATEDQFLCIGGESTTSYSHAHRVAF